MAKKKYICPKNRKCGLIRKPVVDRSYLTVLAFQWRTKIIWQKRNLYTSGPVRSDVLWITDTDRRKVA